MSVAAVALGAWLSLGPAVGAPSDVAESKRLYSVGEEHVAAGHAALAAPLLRRAIVLLPPTASYDEARHALVLRLGYTLMLAHHESGDRTHLEAAADLLRRYAERHAALFGETPEAKAERGAVYEQLYEVERRLDPPKEAPAAGDESSAQSPAEVDDGGPAPVRRTVRVTKRRAAPTLDDPRVFEWLAGPITNAETGLILTAPVLQPLTPARAYVRVSGPVRGNGLTTASRRRARQAAAVAIVESVRPELRACFTEAFARRPTDVVDTEVEVAIDRRGRVRGARVLGPAIIDAKGNACVGAHLTGARLTDRSDAHGKLVVPLAFLWKDATMLDEGNGVIVRDWMDTFRRPREENFGAESWLPPIDVWSDL